MRKIWLIARKELISAYRQRNMLLIMFLSPIILVTIMGLAFSGFADSSQIPDFDTIEIAIVNQDAGIQADPFPLSLMEIAAGNQLINLAEQLQRNPQYGQLASRLSSEAMPINYGNQLAALLLSQPYTGTIPLFDLPCPLTQSSAEIDGPNTESGTDTPFIDLLRAVPLSDPAQARRDVERGDYAAAIFIPPDFSKRIIQDMAQTPIPTPTGAETTTAGVEIYANEASPVAATIINAIITSVVRQWQRPYAALAAILQAAQETIISEGASLNEITRTLKAIDLATLEPLGCLAAPANGPLNIRQQPLNQIQERSTFAMLMVILGGSQAIFFALFTGIFGINSIYEDRIQGTLQRLLVSPTPSRSILLGRLLGNLLIVITQLLILLFAFTMVTAIAEGQWTWIWGSNLPALLLVVLALALFTTGLGVLIVGLAQTPQQVQMIGPLIVILLSVLGGSFGSLVPYGAARISPIWWGIDAMSKLAASEPNIGLNLLVLFAAGILSISLGTYFFRRRMGL